MEPHVPAWSKDGRRPPHADAHGFGSSGGLTRQASAPSLVSGGHNMSFESFNRSPQAAQYDSFNRSPGMRRTSSATSVGGCFGTPVHRPGASSVPRRRPYESALQPPSYQSPLDRGASALSGPAMGSGVLHRADALQLESRLTERLREHSLSSAEATRRPSTATGAVDPRRRPPSGYSGSQWPEDSFNQSGYMHMDRRSLMAHYQDSRTTPSPNGYSKVAAGHRPQDYRGPLKASSSVPSLMQKNIAAEPSVYDHHRHQTPNKSYVEHFADTPAPGSVADSALPESRLKIYSDLFEEVIERDRVFGSLLRKIKTAYDMMLVERPEPGMVPPLPQTRQLGTAGDASWAQDGRGYGGQHSNEPTTRAEDGTQAWEMQRENRVLKDLVERLHLELEEAIKREHRWKQKVVKLKSRDPAAGAGAGARPPAPHGYGHGAPDAYSHGQGDYPGLYRHEAAEEWDEWAARGALPPEDAHMGHPGLHGHHAAGPGGKGFSFGSMRREPGPGDLDGHEAMLNQGGLLSMSSISPQNSAPLPPDGPEGTSGLESARSGDSGHLPQRPTRRHIIKPPNVPSLDFSRLNQHMDEEEEEEGQEEEDREMDAGEEGLEDDEVDDQSERSVDQQRHYAHMMMPDGDEPDGRDARQQLHDHLSDYEDEEDVDNEQAFAQALPKECDVLGMHGMPRRGHGFQELLEADM